MGYDINKKNEETLISILKQRDKIRDTIDKGEGLGIIQKANKLLSKDMSIFHIEELTFEDDSPRKEALENVLSSLRIDGVNFVYLLLGDKNGVSFYFGIVKDNKYQGELELDVDDIGKYILKSSIEGNFRGSKITQQKKQKDSILSKINSMQRFARVDGVPSVNLDSEDFQGVDRLVDVMMGDEFGLMILADPLSVDEMQDIENSLYDIHNKLSPLSKTSVQESTGESKTDGTTKGKNSSDTNGSSQGSSKSDTKGTSKGTSTTNGESSGSSNSTSSSIGGNEGSSDSFTQSVNEGSSVSQSIGESKSYNKAVTTNTGINKSKEFSDKIVNEWMEYIDEVLIKRVEYGRNKGIFNASIYLLSNEKGTLLKLGNTIRSLFSGIEDNKAPLKLTYLTNKNEINNIKNLQISSSNISLKNNMQQASLLFSKNSNKIASWLSTNELSVIAGLPQKEVVGLPLKEEVEFGLNIKTHKMKEENKLLLGSLVRSGAVLDIAVNIDKNHLNKHTFITGVTGSGKTTTCQRILESANIPFMVIEPAKTEYRVLSKTNKNLLIFTLGDDSVAPFRINPFEFFKGENITSRVDMIKANIEAAFDMEAAIPQIIESALYKCYEAYGWDIATSTNTHYEDPFADGIYSFPTLSDLIQQTEIVVKEQGFDDRLKNDYIGSIKARLQGLLVGAKGFMLNTPRSIDFADLIEKDVILELEEIKNGAEKSLIMGFVLINLNEAIKLKYKEYKKQNKDFKHITLIEEAHRLLSKYIPGDNPSKKLGVETFADMLAEVRKYGESLIIVDQIPDKLTPEVLKNTNTKIVHKLFASDDKNAIGNTMALDDEQKAFLSNLEAGRAIVSNQDFSKPIQVQIKELVSTTTSAEVDEQEIRTLCLSYYQKNYKSGIIQGLDIYENEPTLEEVEELLSLKISGLIKGWGELCVSKNINNEFVFDIDSYIKKNKLENKREFISEYLVNKYYHKNDTETKDMIREIIESILTNSESMEKVFSRKQKQYLRLR